MAAGIRMERCEDIQITNCSFSGFDVAIDIVDSADVRVNDSHLGNGRVGLRARGVVGLDAQRNTHGSSSIQSRYAGEVPAVWRRWELTPYVFNAIYGN
jgi:hypothetical protein